jgi:hypothetical protein
MMEKIDGKSTKIGNIYAIPGGGKFAFGKIIYSSEYFKDVILVLFFEKAFSSPSQALSEFYSLPAREIYTGVDSIEKGGWLLVTSVPVSESEKTMSRRIVGGDVWIEDRHIGPASNADLTTLKNMDIYGYRLIEKAVARLN